MSERDPRVCVIGSINIDLMVRAPKIPGAGETVLGGRFSTFPGGKGANQAVAASRCGAEATLVGLVGDDDHGRVLMGALQKERLELSRVQVRSGTPTGVALITSVEGGSNTIVVAPGANAQLSPEDVSGAEAAIGWADVVLAQLEVPVPAVLRAAEMARAAGKVFMLNAAPAPKASDALHELLRRTDVLVVNRSEGAAMANVDVGTDPARITLRLAELGIATVVVTVGALGAILVHHGRPRRISTVKVTALDSVGAGDAFCGCLAVGWAAVARAGHRSEEQFRLVDLAARRAAAAGALATTRRGAIPAIPTREEIDRALEGAEVV